MLEQPSSSLLPRHDRFMWLVREWAKHNMAVPRFIKANNKSFCWFLNQFLGNQTNQTTPMKFKVWINSLGTQVFYQTFWMKAWGHHTPKRSFVLANTHLVGQLDTGKMKRKALESEISTTDTYVSKDGRKRFKGNGNLKATQFLG